MNSFRLINCILIAIHFYATYQKLLYDRLSRWFTWNEISIPDDSSSYEILALGTTRSKESLKIVFAIFPILWWIMAPNNQFVYFYQFRHFLLFVAIVPSAQSIPNVPSLPSIPFTPSMPSMPSIPPRGPLIHLIAYTIVVLVPRSGYITPRSPRGQGP